QAICSEVCSIKATAREWSIVVSALWAPHFHSTFVLRPPLYITSTSAKRPKLPAGLFPDLEYQQANPWYFPISSSSLLEEVIASGLFTPDHWDQELFERMKTNRALSFWTNRGI